MSGGRWKSAPVSVSIARDTFARPPKWTIGHGTTLIDGYPVAPYMTCTEAQADAWAIKDMTDAAHYVEAAVHVPLSEWELAALTSLTYNIGIGHFRESSVLSALNCGDPEQAADNILLYDHGENGEVLEGLRRRRERERGAFLLGMGKYVSVGAPVLPPKAAPAPLSAADVLNQDVLDGTPIPT